MPVYVYRRRDGSSFELVERITEDALVICPTTGQSVERVLQPFSPRYRGSGFYSKRPQEGPAYSRSNQPSGACQPRAGCGLADESATAPLEPMEFEVRGATGKPLPRREGLKVIGSAEDVVSKLAQAAGQGTVRARGATRLHGRTHRVRQRHDGPALCRRARAGRRKSLKTIFYSMRRART
jgi:predicted nucleic acid-binding Zn ribbon protein